MEPFHVLLAKNTIGSTGWALFDSVGSAVRALVCVGCMPKNSFTESINAKLEAPDALALITRVRPIMRPNIIVRKNVACDGVKRLDIKIILGPYLRPDNLNANQMICCDTERDNAHGISGSRSNSEITGLFPICQQKLFENSSRFLDRVVDRRTY